MVNSIAHRITRSGKKALGLMLVALLVLPAQIASADTGISAVSTADTNLDGHIDRLVVTFSSTPADLKASDFVVSGYALAAGWNPALLSGNVNVDLTPKAVYDTDATPAMTFRGEAPSVSTKDNAAPVLVKASGDDFGSIGLFKDPMDMVQFLFSEPIALYLGGSKIPAQTTADKHLALEQAIVMGGPPPGCEGDGDGLPAPGGSGNFPAYSATPGKTPDPADDPIDENWSANATAGTRTITVSQKANNSGSSSNRQFSVLPNSSTPCTAAISLTNNSNVREFVNQSTTPGGTGLSAVNVGSGSLGISHVLGKIVGSPITADVNKDGKIDQVLVTFNHPVDPSSVSAASIGRFGISDGTNVATGLTFPSGAVTGSQVKINFQPPASWNTATKPVVTYTDSGTCLADGVVVLTNNNLNRQCAGAFGVEALDKAVPVVLTARTLDDDHDGQLDGVELSYSEPVSDASFGESVGFTVAGYTITNPGFATGSAVNDNTVRILFSEIRPDTNNTPTITYAPGVVADLATNSAAAFENLQSLDGAGPVLVGGTVYDLKDGTIAGHDGRIDETLFVFSEPIADASVSLARFGVDGVAVNTIVTAPLNTDDAAVANDNMITLSKTGGVNGSDAKDLTVLPDAVTDLAGVASVDSGSGAGITVPRGSVADKALPMVLSVTPDGQSTAARAVKVIFSEAMKTDSAPAVTWGAEPNFNDAIIAPDTATSVTGWEAGGVVWDGISPAQNSSACSEPTGCSWTLKIANATGADNNAIEPDTSFLWTVDVVAPNIPSVLTPSQNSVAARVSGSKGNVVVSGIASEPNLTVQVFEAGTLVGAAVSDSDKKWSVGLSDLALGSHTVTTKAIDAGGNQSDASAARVFSVKRITSLTLNKSASIIYYHQNVTLSGTLKDATGATIKDSTVAIQRQVYGTSTWTTLTSVKTNASGNYSFTRWYGESDRFRAVYGGTSTLDGVTSPVGSVLARVALNAVPSATRIKLGQSITIKGSVRPAHVGKVMRLQQSTSQGWKTIAFSKLNSASDYVFSVRPGSRGTYRYKVYYVAQDADHLENYVYVTLTVV